MMFNRLDTNLAMKVVNSSTDIPTTKPTMTPTVTPSSAPTVLPTANPISLDVDLTALGKSVTALCEHWKILENGLKETLVVDVVSIRKIFDIGLFGSL